MKKKEYINPEMQVVKIQHHGQLLVDSVVQSILSDLSKTCENIRGGSEFST